MRFSRLLTELRSRTSRCTIFAELSDSVIAMHLNLAEKGETVLAIVLDMS